SRGFTPAPSHVAPVAHPLDPRKLCSRDLPLRRLVDAAVHVAELLWELAGGEVTGVNLAIERCHPLQRLAHILVGVENSDGCPETLSYCRNGPHQVGVVGNNDE